MPPSRLPSLTPTSDLVLENFSQPLSPKPAESEVGEPTHLATAEEDLHTAEELFQLLRCAKAGQGIPSKLSIIQEGPSGQCKLEDLKEPEGVVVPNPRSNMASSSSNVVGVHYRVGKKIGEGSFGVIFEGTNLLNNQQVAIKFVRLKFASRLINTDIYRNRARAMLLNYEMSIVPTKFLLAAVSGSQSLWLSDLLTGSSRHTQCLLLWSGRSSQYSCH